MPDPLPVDSPESTPSVRSAAEEAILWAAIKDAVTKRYAEARAAAVAKMGEQGVLRMEVRAAEDRERLGTLSTTEGSWAVEVDEQKLLAWVRVNRPGEAYQPATPWLVREAFVEWCTQQAKANAAADAAGDVSPGPVPCDLETGAVIPGVKAVWKDGNTTVTANREGKARAAEILSSIVTQGRGLPSAAVRQARWAYTAAYPDAVEGPSVDAYQPVQPAEIDGPAPF